MNALTRFVLALVLAAAAGVLNFVYLTYQPPPAQYTALKSAVKRGDVIQEKHLTSVGVPGERAELNLTFIPFDARGVVLQSRATRDYRKGDLMLQRDLDAASDRDAAELDILKFRVIAVGSRFKTPNPDPLSLNSAEGQTVTIAIKQPHLNDPASQRMLRLVKHQASAAEPPPDLKILGVVMYPRGADPPSDQPAADEVALAISLRDIDSVPAVILAGGEIGFLLSPEYP
ncbi:MAG TPA: hypothetical protein VGE52_01360 [Pirellulales bacterium]